MGLYLPETAYLAAFSLAESRLDQYLGVPLREA